MAGTGRIPAALCGRRKAVLVAGAAAALLGTGSASAMAASAAPTTMASHRHHDEPATAAGRSAAAFRHSGRAGSGRGPAHAPTAAAFGAMSWSQVAEIQAHRTDPSLRGDEMPAADQLQPVGTYGPQQFMPITGSQYGNATTIVQQALAKGMGVRSAVIAVATSMQESELSNINYGTGDSLGLFQQQADCGWGSPQQIMDPSYAADAFLTALQKYQVDNPGWAHQPLWQSAQGVQASGFPTAYAKWESQAAGLVRSIATHLT